MSLKTVEQTFREAVLADSALNGWLAGRVYLVQLPQNVTYPCVTYQRISTNRNWVQAQGGQFSDFGWIRLQVDIWAQTATGGQDVSSIAQEFVRLLRTLNAYSSAGQGGSARVLNQMMGVEGNTQPPTFRIRMDIQVFFSDNL